ncbi:hypothetical protein HW932_01985 [Allochromatium humboldtianum]|uniref:Phage tail assembly chaperone-like domain-containing protein n=2 Tax=Allochromatium humboldtianum TaxID=504901 RepID=A0A850R0E0_9GAMM|nr:hypothetical protein [Allochromatium humboldtianum]
MSGETDGALPTTGEGQTLVAGVRADPVTDRVVVREGVLQVETLPPRPSMHHEFDFQADTWKIPSERATFLARLERDRRLKASDWTQLSDAPGVARNEWQRYRQALRDVPAQPGFPEHIEWPTPP